MGRFLLSIRAPISPTPSSCRQQGFLAQGELIERVGLLNKLTRNPCCGAMERGTFDKALLFSSEPAASQATLRRWRRRILRERPLLSYHNLQLGDMARSTPGNSRNMSQHTFNQVQRKTFDRPELSNVTSTPLNRKQSVILEEFRV